MTLTNRLTLFFLIALALVLAAFSAALYALARTHLIRQVGEQAASDLDTLVAAAEVEPDGLEWDRRDRTLWPTRRHEPRRFLNGCAAVYHRPRATGDVHAADDLVQEFALRVV